MKRSIKHTLALACLAIAAGPAFASAASSAAMGKLVITLTDLDHTDGITPWMSFKNLSTANVLSDTVSFGDYNDGNVSIRHAPAELGLVTAATQTDWSKSAGSVYTADTIGGFASLSAYGQADSGLEGYGSYTANASAASSPMTEFTLSPNTAISFSVSADLTAWTTMGYNLEADQGEEAFALAMLNVWGDVNGVFQSGGQRQELITAFDVRDDNTTIGQYDSWSGTMSASFYNYSAVEVVGGFQSFVGVEGRSATWDGVTPVPEPETYLMMLCGLLFVGAMARRRTAGS